MQLAYILYDFEAITSSFYVITLRTDTCTHINKGEAAKCCTMTWFALRSTITYSSRKQKSDTTRVGKSVNQNCCVGAHIFQNITGPSGSLNA